MVKKMTITGKSNVKIAPDTTQICLVYKKTFPSYNRCLEESISDLNTVVKCIQEFGFSRKELKTSKFSIEPHYESYRDKDDIYKKKLMGYEYHQNLFFSFKNNNALLGDLLFAIAHNCNYPEIEINYLISDEQSVKNKALELAVQDGIKKAELIANAAHVKLGDIVDIDYSWVTISLTRRTFDSCSRTYSKSACYEATTYDIDIEPDDIDVGDEVRLVFEIGGE